jgi:hypothetical protein
LLLLALQTPLQMVLEIRQLERSSMLNASKNKKDNQLLLQTPLQMVLEIRQLERISIFEKCFSYNRKRFQKRSFAGRDMR